jgi:hypothetical protein
VVISTSSTGGASWSTSALVNLHTEQAAYDPAVYVNRSGVVGVSYFQWSQTSPGQETTSLYIRHSTSPGSSTVPPSFDAPTPLGGPFNNLAAPFAGGYFLGDYQGLVATPSGFVPFFAKTNCADGGPATRPSCAAVTSLWRRETPHPPTTIRRTFTRSPEPDRRRAQPTRRHAPASGTRPPRSSSICCQRQPRAWLDQVRRCPRWKPVSVGPDPGEVLDGRGHEHHHADRGTRPEAEREHVIARCPCARTLEEISAAIPRCRRSF